MSILAGFACTLYRDLFLDFVNDIDVPVLLTWRAMDLLDADDPLYIGRPGMIGQPKAHRYLQAADRVLILGARLDKETVAYNYANFAPLAEKTVVDIDAAELAKLPDDWHKVNMDVGVFMRGVLDGRIPLCGAAEQIQPRG